MAKTGPALSDAFARLVKQHREAKGVSRVALAEAAGLHQTYIGLLERGERSPSLDTANAIATALGMSLGDLIHQATKLQKSSARK